ncbi:MAG TPA: hypothetical protein EYP71_07520 [Dehalococcoidia bacterium]|nr:hypothetical protein [Dehalococcoidia bacterium]
MDHPTAVVEKAQRLEQLLQGVEQGEPLEQVCAELEVQVEADRLATLQAKYEAGGCTWEGLIDGRYGHPQKANSALREWLYERKRQDEELTAPELAKEIEARFGKKLSPGHINYLLRKVELTRSPGRPSSQPVAEADLEGSEAPSGSLDNAGVFFLEASKQEMGVTQTVECCLETACWEYQETHPGKSLRIVVSEPETLWHKLDHLLYLPILNMTRPRDLYYDQGDGLGVLYGFTYKYLTLEHFLGQMTRLGIGHPLADKLAYCYSQGWYPGEAELFIFSDWHVKPHWTKQDAHCGHVAMWKRVMPGTKQLIINGPEGHLLGGWNYPVDTHLNHVLVDLEADLATKLERPIAYNIFDSEGSGLPIAQRYAEADRDYISVLPRWGDQSLPAFQVQGRWQPVEGDPDHEAVDARWADTQKAAEDPRRLTLMRRVGRTDPTRVYAGRIPAHLPAAEVPSTHRQRWQSQEGRIREMVNGVNLNANFGYTYDEVPSRTRKRRWEEAQAKVEVTQRKLAEHKESIANLWTQLKQLKQTYAQQQTTQQASIETYRIELAERQQTGKPTRRCEQRLTKQERQLVNLTTRFQKRRQSLIERPCRHRKQRSQLSRQLAQREATRDAIDTETLCRERHLEKDQIMLDLQVLLTNLHDWARQHYFAPEWQRLELDTATKLIYRKSGQVTWHEDRIEVVLDAYRYPQHQQAMEATCRRFNEANLHWRDGRLLHIHVARGP